MSYILDALRKSQQTRQSGPAPAARGAVHNISFPWPAGGWWLVSGFVLLFGMLVAAVLFWHGPLGGLLESPTPVAGNEPVPAAPATAQPIEKIPAPETPARKTNPVSDLAEQAKLPAPAASKKAVVARSAKKSAVPRRPAAAKTATASASAPDLAADNTPLLQQMPNEFRSALPALAMTIHVYSPDESQRILFLNNREYHKGSLIEGGVRVEDIVPDGVVLSFRGERFKLSRPR